jgi:glycine betaine/proline transport system permease protein
MTFLQDQPKVTDNEVLDQWRIPFGDWYDQAVDWVDNELKPILDGIDWLFSQLVDFVNDTVLLGVPWFVIVLAFFVLGWVLQNIRVGIFSAIALTLCGLLGTGYWDQTAKTIGFIMVAVFLCTVIGIPIGIMAGRVDSFWRAVRPVLDAMQVVHSFVYMLPFIYFFGIGEVSATIVTMVFALPPLIRLTNLGIRQVPEDVVEASRAFGQTELAILRDVQLPLARPAIMTGINQTLLLSISMLGIAAIMGAGGLAQFMFRALSNQDPALSGSAGLSFFLVAVVLDRLTQRDGDNSQSLAVRMKRAWANRTTPENLLDTPAIELDLPETASSQVVYEPVNAQERTGIMVTAAGAVVVIISLFLTWNSGGGWFTSFSRRVDELGQVPATGSRDAVNITADSFNGLEASGGSWFGYVLGFLAIAAIAAGAAVMRQPGNTSRWLNADGSLVFSLASLVVTFVYLLSQPSELSVAESSIGSVVALIGALIMTIGSVLWIMAAKHEPLRPLPSRGVVSPVVVASLGMCLLIGAGFANFTYDERVESVITVELQETLDALEAEARDPETEQRRSLAIINEMTSLRASAVQDETITISGFASNGPLMARWTLVPGILGLVSTVIAAGFVFKDTRLRWITGATSLGLGAGLLGVSLGWTGTLARATDQNIVSGVGVFFLMLAGATLANSGRSIIQEFHRSRVYLDIDDQEIADMAGAGSEKPASKDKMAAAKAARS